MKNLVRARELTLLGITGTHQDPHWRQTLPVRLLSQKIFSFWQLLLSYDQQEMPGIQQQRQVRA